MCHAGTRTPRAKHLFLMHKHEQHEHGSSMPAVWQLDDNAAAHDLVLVMLYVLQA
jgi:hypothetical protein